jgi:hypothetical protein
MNMKNPDMANPAQDERRLAIETLENDWEAALDEYHRAGPLNEEKTSHFQEVFGALRMRASALNVDRFKLVDRVSARRKAKTRGRERR